MLFLTSCSLAWNAFFPSFTVELSDSAWALSFQEAFNHLLQHTCTHTLLDGLSVLTHAATAPWAYASAVALVTQLKWPSYVLLCPTGLLRNKSDEAHPMCLLWIAEISAVARNVQSLPLLQSYSAFGRIQGLADTEDWIWYLAPQPSNTNDRFRR